MKIIYYLITSVIDDVREIQFLTKSIVSKQRNKAMQHEIVLMNKSHSKIVDTTKINEGFMEHYFFRVFY